MFDRRLNSAPPSGATLCSSRAATTSFWAPRPLASTTTQSPRWARKSSPRTPRRRLTRSGARMGEPSHPRRHRCRDWPSCSTPELHLALTPRRPLPSGNRRRLAPTSPFPPFPQLPWRFERHGHGSRPGPWLVCGPVVPGQSAPFDKGKHRAGQVQDGKSMEQLQVRLPPRLLLRQVPRRLILPHRHARPVSALP